jgi:hypothetical protein
MCPALNVYESSKSDTSMCGVKVAVRVKPPSSTEGNITNQGSITVDSEHAQIILRRNRLFGFDCVFGTSSTQNDVYGYVSSLVNNFLDGFNATIFAYGQTGSGKTFTMGTGSSLTSENSNNEKQGILPRVVSHIFSRLSESDYAKYKVLNIL